MVTKIQLFEYTVLILDNNQLNALFPNVFISCPYMFRATSAHHQEDQIVLIHVFTQFNKPP